MFDAKSQRTRRILLLICRSRAGGNPVLSAPHLKHTLRLRVSASNHKQTLFYFDTEAQRHRVFLVKRFNAKSQRTRDILLLNCRSRAGGNPAHTIFASFAPLRQPQPQHRCINFLLPSQTTKDRPIPAAPQSLTNNSATTHKAYCLPLDKSCPLIHAVQTGEI